MGILEAMKDHIERRKKEKLPSNVFGENRRLGMMLLDSYL